jgi:hypothetical protein
MSFLWDLHDLLVFALKAAFAFVLGYATTNPVVFGLSVLAVVRLMGTTVQSGSKGVLFVGGRVRKQRNPGFHPLVPVLMTVRKTPVRSVSLDLFPQRLTTADGLVYDVQVNS